MNPASKFCRWLVPPLLAVVIGHLSAPAHADFREDALRHPSAADTCARWENPTLAPNRSPFMTDHVGVFDAADQRMIVCGGDPNLGADLRDVWICSLKGTPVWTRVAGLEPWPPFLNSRGTAAALDSRRNRMLIFGGTGGSLDCGVWALSLGPTPYWSKLDAAGPGPCSRSEASAIYDEAADRFVVFGGVTNGGSQPTTLNDVWALSLDEPPSWTELHPSGDPPSPREEPTAIYDARRQRMVVFGGSPWSTNVPPDTDRVWILSLGVAPQWMSVAPSGPHPLARRAHAACYDPNHDQMIVTGGFGMSDRFATEPMDAWRLSLDRMQWSSVDANAAPAGRGSLTAVFDPKHDRMIAFGGTSATEWATNECWSLSLRRPEWTMISPSSLPPTPSPRLGGRGAFDPSSGRVVLALGNGETWALSPHGAARWRQILPADSIFRVPHYWSYLIADVRRDRMLAFDDVDLWSLHLEPNPRWEKLPRVGNPPPARSGPSLVLDPIGDRLLLYGGYATNGWDSYRYLDDLWELPLSGPLQWRQVEIAGVRPPQMAFHSGVFDARRRRMVISGGHGSSLSSPSQTWALALDGTAAWTQLGISGSADFRLGPFAAYDPVRERILGFDFTTAAPLVALSLRDNRMVPLSPEGTQPEERLFRFFAFDPRSDRLVVFGPNMLSYQQRQDLMFVQFADCAPHPPGWSTSDSAVMLHGRPRIAWRGLTDPGGRAEISLVLESGAPAAVEAFDIGGRRVWREPMETSTAGRTVTTLELPASLMPGIYLVRAIQGNEVATTRVVVLR